MHNALILDRSRLIAADIVKGKINMLSIYPLKIKLFFCNNLILLKKIALTSRKYLSIASWSFTVWLIFGVFDPFGFDASTDRQSYMVAERALSPFHDLFHPEIRDQITVVLLNESDQENEKEQCKEIIDCNEKKDCEEKIEPWPPKYSRHGNILSSIIEQKPRILFADITFQTNREDEYSLNNMITTIKESMENNPTIPVFIGALHKNDKTPKEVSNLLQKTYVSWDGAPENYPLLGKENKSGSNQDKSNINYPAFSIFMEICEQDRSLMICEGHHRSDIDRHDAFDRDMEVRWLSSTPPQLHETLTASVEEANQECHNYENKDDYFIFKFINRLYAASRNLLIPVINTINEALQEEFINYNEQLSCPPFMTLSVKHLTSGGWSKFIENKIVFFGHHLVASRDLHETPAHGYMPGVYIHAMALENLLRYGSNYSKVSDDYMHFFKLSDLIELTIVVVLSVFFKIISDLKTNNNIKDKINENYEVIFVLLMITIIVSGAIIISTYRLLPHSNLIAIAAMAFLIKEHASWEWGIKLRRIMVKISLFIIFAAIWTYICSFFHWNQFIWATALILVPLQANHLLRILSADKS